MQNIFSVKITRVSKMKKFRKEWYGIKLEIMQNRNDYMGMR